MKGRTFHTVKTAPKYTRQIVELESKWITIKRIYMAAHFPGLGQTLQ